MKYISEVSVLAVLHDDVVVVGCVDHIDNLDDVVVLETAVDLQLLFDGFGHVGVVIDCISNEIHCDFSMILTAIQTCVASSRQRKTWPEAPAPRGWSK